MSSLPRNNRLLRVATIAALAYVAIVAIAIFALTEQAPETTSAESSFVNDWLVSVFGGIPGLYDERSGLWLGIHIRHWAHVVEFGVLGLFVSLAVLLVRLRKPLLPTGLASAGICCALSLLDQCHKLFVPGRHFDCFDLVMDAFGYGSAVLLVMVVAAIVKNQLSPKTIIRK